MIGNTEMREMDDPLINAPPLAPTSGGFIEMLRDADTLLELMGREPLGVVGNIATQLSACANEAGAYGITDAARAISRIASARAGAALVGAMQRLASAMSRARRAYQ